MNILVITTLNTIYAAYDQTICFKAAYSNYEGIQKALTNAKATAFDYSLNAPKASCSTIELPIHATDEDIFNYLKSHN